MNRVSNPNLSNRHERETNYAARRVGAAVLAAGVLLGGAKMTEGAVNRIRGKANNLPVLEEGQPGTEPYTVELGDTLWGIAKERTNGEVRALVDSLGQQPDAENGLQQGDQLIVPKRVNEGK